MVKCDWGDFHSLTCARFAAVLQRTLTGQISQDAEGNPVVVDVEFDAFFAPDPDNSTGRFANVVGGGWQMIANAESIPLPTEAGDAYTGPFDYTWSGTGTLEYAKKSK
jgi:hypothetical protein